LKTLYSRRPEDPLGFVTDVMSDQTWVSLKMERQFLQTKVQRRTARGIQGGEKTAAGRPLSVQLPLKWPQSRFRGGRPQGVEVAVHGEP
jgi:hypothetical protein